MSTPNLASYHQPAEWDAHRACWLAWPSHADLWQEDLAEARSEFLGLCRAIAEGERLEILVPDAQGERLAQAALAGLPARYHRIPFGDIWLRDTAPIFLIGDDGVATVRFCFNGWGGKYQLPGDSEVSARIAQTSALPSFKEDWVLEGGSVEVDGEGTCLTTRQCLLNPNRNPGLPQLAIETNLRRALGVTTILWLDEGLLNDHTDGHIDTLARFVAPGEVVCMEPADESDPNAETLKRIRADLESFRDAQGRKLKVWNVPSPGKVTDASGKILPASYLNFYIANRTVVVPTYGVDADKAAVATLAKRFPGRHTVGTSARAILSGGGAFHCITQQEPMP